MIRMGIASESILRYLSSASRKTAVSSTILALAGEEQKTQIHQHDEST